MGPWKTRLFTFAALGLAAQASAAVFTVNGDTADAEVNKASIGDGGGTAGNQSKSGTGAILCGQYSATPDAICNVFVFQLPTLNAGDTISSVNLRLNAYRSGTVAFDGDIYGLGARASNAVSGGDFYAGTSGGDSTDATLIQASAFTPSTSSSNTNLSNTSNAALATYLQTQYSAGGTGKYIFFRVSPNFTTVPTNAGVNGFTITPADGATTAVVPQLTINTVPEPTTGAVLAGVAAFGLLRRRRVA